MIPYKRKKKESASPRKAGMQIKSPLSPSSFFRARHYFFQRLSLLELMLEVSVLMVRSRISPSSVLDTSAWRIHGCSKICSRVGLSDGLRDKHHLINSWHSVGTHTKWWISILLLASQNWMTTTTPYLLHSALFCQVMKAWQNIQGTPLTMYCSLGDAEQAEYTLQFVGNRE